MRILLWIEYNGTRYSGWQRQNNALSVQQTVEDSLSLFLKKPVKIFGASRTDAKVHAFNMAAHFDTDDKIPPEKYSYALNNILPYDIRITKSAQADDNFHARFDSKKKIYIYKYYFSPMPSAVFCDSHYIVNQMPDIALMKKGAEYLIGKHDFSAFYANNGQKVNPVREVEYMEINSSPLYNGEEIMLKICGKSFLYNMVRVIAAQLLKAGQGKIPPEYIKDILLSKDRSKARETAPPQGLYLYEIVY